MKILDDSKNYLWLIIIKLFSLKVLTSFKLSEFFFKSSVKKVSLFFSSFLWDLLHLKHSIAIAGTTGSTRGKIVDQLLTLKFQYFNSETEYENKGMCSILK